MLATRGGEEGAEEAPEAVDCSTCSTSDAMWLQRKNLCVQILYMLLFHIFLEILLKFYTCY